MMNSSTRRRWRWWALAVMTAGTVRAAAVPKLPVEVFALSETYAEMKLSPDGEFVAFLRDHDHRQALFFSDLATLTLRRIDPEQLEAVGQRPAVTWFEWIGDKRVILQSAGALSAVDRDGKRWKYLTGPLARLGNQSYLRSAELLRTIDPQGKYVMVHGHLNERFDTPAGSRMTSEMRLDNPMSATTPTQVGAVAREMRLDSSLNAAKAFDYRMADVFRVDAAIGSFRVMTENPGKASAWTLDGGGVARVGSAPSELAALAVFRETEKSPWRPLPVGGYAGRVLPLGFDGAGQKLYLTATTPAGRNGVYLMDPAAVGLGQLLAQDANYDVGMGRVIFSEKKQAVVGVGYATETEKVLWWDREFAARQAAVDAALPKKVNRIVNFSRDEQKLLVLSYSDRDPGGYYVFDLKAKSMRQLAVRRAEVKPEEMADMLPVSFPARDGQTVRGYLTFAPGQERKNQPLVVLAKDGVRGRVVWGFDPLVQFLANRGYAVLQVNARGTEGFGAQFLEQGLSGIGRVVQQDLDDGVKWTVSQGLVDPKRVAIMGARFGAYATLFALGQSAGLYRCGIALHGFYDWHDIFRGARSNLGDLSRILEWEQDFAEAQRADDAYLQAISPTNFADKITAPVLIVHREEVAQDLYNQTPMMVKALEKAGKKPEVYVEPKIYREQDPEQNRILLYRRIEAFLAQNLAAKGGTGI